MSVKGVKVTRAKCAVSPWLHFHIKNVNQFALNYRALKLYCKMKCM